MTEMNKKLLTQLRTDVVTWIQLSELDTNSSLIVSKYFSFKNVEALKTVCTAANKRGHAFFKVNYLTETLLGNLLISIQTGLTELVKVGTEQQAVVLLKDIKDYNEAIYNDLYNSSPNMTNCDAIESFIKLIEIQTKELGVLTARQTEFKRLLSGLNTFDVGIESLRKLLSSFEDENVSSSALLDSHLDQLHQELSVANSIIDNLLDADISYSTFIVNENEGFVLDSLRAALSAEGRTSPDLTRLVYKKRNVAESTSVLEPYIDNLNKITNQVNMLKAQQASAYMQK